MTSVSRLQLETMLRDPTAAFASPERVLADEALTREQKIREGMPGSGDSVLRPVLLALHRAAGEAPVRTDPSKHHVPI
jgi:hypothetical protein